MGDLPAYADWDEHVTGKGEDYSELIFAVLEERLGLSVNVKWVSSVFEDPADFHIRVRYDRY